MNFKVIDEDGKLIECDVIGVFNMKEKDFIVYTTDGEEICASLFKMDGDYNMIISPITEESDWDIVDKFLEGSNELY